MDTTPQTEPKRSRLRIRPRHVLFGMIAFVLLLWIFFFDSYSIVQHFQWQQEKSKLQESNKRLEQNVLQLEEQLGTLDSTEVIEKHAREDFGMRRQGETVYRVVKPDSTAK